LIIYFHFIRSFKKWNWAIFYWERRFQFYWALNKSLMGTWKEVLLANRCAFQLGKRRDQVQGFQRSTALINANTPTNSSLKQNSCRKSSSERTDGETRISLGLNFFFFFF
jgi:hypothetical protein